jgi:hypothetical protein
LNKNSIVGQNAKLTSICKFEIKLKLLEICLKILFQADWRARETQLTSSEKTLKFIDTPEDLIVYLILYLLYAY